MIRQSLKGIVWALLLGTLTLPTIQPAQAQQTNQWLEPTVRGLTEFKIRNKQWFESLSPRQQNLVRQADRVIWNYQQQTGQPVYPNQQNTIAVMQAIGASSSDYNLIAQVVHTNYIFANGNRQIQNFIQETQQFLNNLPF
jgi:hypothetical protein